MKAVKKLSIILNAHKFSKYHLNSDLKLNY